MLLKNIKIVLLKFGFIYANLYIKQIKMNLIITNIKTEYLPPKATSYSVSLWALWCHHHTEYSKATFLLSLALFMSSRLPIWKKIGFLWYFTIYNLLILIWIVYSLWIKMRYCQHTMKADNLIRDCMR